MISIRYLQEEIISSQSSSPSPISTASHERSYSLGRHRAMSMTSASCPHSLSFRDRKVRRSIDRPSDRAMMVNPLSQIYEPIFPSIISQERLYLVYSEKQITMSYSYQIDFSISQGHQTIGEGSRRRSRLLD